MRPFIIAIAISCVALPAQARDILLSVPVDFSGMPSPVTDVLVSCSIKSATGREMAGVQNKRIPLNGGGYRGIVTFQFMPSGYPPGVDPTPDARSYHCGFSFFYTCTSASGGLGTCQSFEGGTLPEDRPGASLFRIAAGSTIVQRVEGNFSRADAIILPRRF